MMKPFLTTSLEDPVIQQAMVASNGLTATQVE
jgi:hypothetical protein